jgi:hypothetical protein
MGCNCGGRKAKEAMTAAAAEQERQRSEFEQRAAAETAKASGQ